MVSHIVTGNNNEQAPHNPPRSDGGDGQDGGAIGQMPLHDPGNEPGRLEWTDELRDDLLDAYDESEPVKRGYMRRMHRFWCLKHPELDHLSQQRLRDYVAYLRRSGYVRTPQSQQNQPEILPPGNQREEPVIIDAPAVLLSVDEELVDRSVKINLKFHVRRENLARVNSELEEELPEDIDMLSLNNAVYRAASRLLPNNSTGDFRQKIRKIERRIQQIASKIDLARQQASRIESVLEFLTTNRPFTEKIRRLAAKLRQQHHTLGRTVLLTIKQRYLDRIRSLSVIKKNLMKKARGIRDNNTFLIKPSGLFQDPTPKVDDTPPVLDVERKGNL